MDSKKQKRKGPEGAGDNQKTESPVSAQEATKQGKEAEPVSWEAEMEADFAAIRAAGREEQARVDHITGLIEKYQGRVAEYESQIAGLQAEIEALRARIPEALKNLEDPENITQEIKGKEAQISAVSGYITELEANILPAVEANLTDAKEALVSKLNEARYKARVRWAARIYRQMLALEEIDNFWDEQNQLLNNGLPVRLNSAELFVPFMPGLRDIFMGPTIVGKNQFELDIRAAAGEVA